MKHSKCAYCGTVHDRHEDAACGCGCGDNPMGCGACMSQGGPTPRYGAGGRKLEPKRGWSDAMFDDGSDYDY